MNKLLRAHADAIIASSINAVKPDEAVSRALAGTPELLILDDASSALDFRTEAALRRALREEYKNTATVMIAQRISAIMHCDLILVMEDGEPKGVGTHEELMQNCPLYKEIAHLQLGGEEE